MIVSAAEVMNYRGEKKLEAKRLIVEGSKVVGGFVKNIVNIESTSYYEMRASTLNDSNKVKAFVLSRQTLNRYPRIEYPVTDLLKEALLSADMPNLHYRFRDENVEIQSAEDIKFALLLNSRRENQIVKFFEATGELVRPVTVSNTVEKEKKDEQKTVKTPEKKQSEIEMLKAMLDAEEAKILASLTSNVPQVSDEEVAEDTDNIPEDEQEGLPITDSSDTGLTKKQQKALDDAARKAADAQQA